MRVRNLLYRIKSKLTPQSIIERNRIIPIIAKYNNGVSNEVVKKKARIYLSDRSIEDMSDYVNQMSKCLNNLHFDKSENFVYPYDTFSYRQLRPGKQIICSNTVDFEVVIDSNLVDIKKRLNQCPNRDFEKTELKLIESIECLAKRIKVNGIDKTVYCKPSSFKEAIQKILFYDALFWQANHWHVGLGRLDHILYPYYEADSRKGLITRNEAKELLIESLHLLNRDVVAKSGLLLGDTGQYILLGGIDKEGKTVENELTHIFLEIFKEYKKQDPKLILRVNKETSDEIWQKAIDCIVTGIGSPLIMNEELIIKGMREFGFKQDDLWNVGTSACWEPLVIGKSFDQNNALPNIPILKSLNELILSKQTFSTFNELLQSVKDGISKQIKECIHDIEFDVSPLYSLFFDSCIEKGVDYTKGGADYSYHGVQVVSLPNLINALLNIKLFVYQKAIVSMEQCYEAIVNNYKGYDDLRKLFLSNDKKYGSADKEVLNLTNDLMDFISLEVSKYQLNGEKVKIGYSSSQYIEQKGMVAASLDGRYDNDPFAVHISPVSHRVDIQEVLDFAGNLDYSGNKMNGNVVDFILPSAFIHHTDKLIKILKGALTQGVYEIQLNVLDAKTLKDAKQNPEKYPNLIVRVWGFSAYFNDLPETYKDNLIKRAESYA